MVSIGLKALPLRKHKSSNLSQDSSMAGEDKFSHNKGGKNRKMGRKGSKNHTGFRGGVSTENKSGGVHGGAKKFKKFEKDRTTSTSQASFVRFGFSS